MNSSRQRAILGLHGFNFESTSPILSRGRGRRLCLRSCVHRGPEGQIPKRIGVHNLRLGEVFKSKKLFESFVPPNETLLDLGLFRMGIPGLDRAAMEADRLARLEKRKAATEVDEGDAPKAQKISHSSQPAKASSITNRSNKESKMTRLERIPTSSTEHESDEHGVQQNDIRNNNRSTENAEVKLDVSPHSLPTESSISAGNASRSLPFPDGAIRKTWAFRHDRHNDIKIEEVLQKNDLQIAVLSSWQLDMEWIASKLNWEQTMVWFVMQSKDPREQTQWRQEALSWSRSIRICFPPLASSPYTCMHSKLMLLFYADYLRVVVPSANLVSYDWGESGLMENTVFLIDLPRLPSSEQGAKNVTLTPFATELLSFIDAMGLDKTTPSGTSTIEAGIKKFDFSRTRHLAFIHTICGSHLDEDSRSTGFPLLAKSVRDLGLQTKPKESMQVDFAASSIGALTSNRFEDMFRALKGIVNDPKPPSKKAFASQTQGIAEVTALNTRFRVFFPSHETVKNSKGGEDGAGTIFMSSWDKADFPQDCFRDYISARSGLLSHNKMILVRTQSSAFVYTGSANFSPSAWGNLSLGKDKCTKLYCANWECGVLFRITPPTDIVNKDQVKDGGVLPLEIFKNSFDVPFTWPSRSFEGSLRPWIQVKKS